LTAPVMAGAQQDRGQRGRPSANQRDPRIALVICNCAYADGRLANPVNDARDMAATLREFGFEVLSGENQNRRQMEDLIREFGRKIRGGGVGMFYFAGHGVQVGGNNYLIPIGAVINGEAEVKYEAVDVGFALAQMEEARNRLNIVVLDACRNNPFERSFRSLSQSRGLASIEASVGTLIAYATAPGRTASDGSGRNGLYTKELLTAMRSPGLKLEDVFKRTRAEVRRQSNNQQIPWEASSIEGDFYFLAERQPTTVATNTAPVDPEAAQVTHTIRYARVSGNKPLITMNFTTAKVDPNGRVTRIPGQTANGYVEPLPGGVKLEMVEISGGTFMMGSPADEEGRSEDEGPQHRVTVGDFYIGRFEVTQGQWKAVMGSLPPKMSDLVGEFKGDDLPVISVSWGEAKEFIEKLNRLTGGDYRLPSEAEWEYAARAGNTARFAFGDKFSAQIINNSGKVEKIGSRGVANAFGLLDMHGNVKEWCEDDWHGSFWRSPIDGTAWVDTPRSNSKVLRGGSLGDNVYACRSASREPGDRGISYFNDGSVITRDCRTGDCREGQSAGFRVVRK